MAVSAHAFRRRNPVVVMLLLVVLTGFFYLVFYPSSDSIPDMTRRLGRQGADRIAHWTPSGGSAAVGPTGSGSRAPPVVHYKMNSVVPSADPIRNRETVLVLTPMAKFTAGYWDNLLKLNYPRELISLGFILPQSREGNAALAELNDRLDRVQSSRHPFKKVTILRQDTDFPLTSQSEKERHKLENQKMRRAAMSKARNSLLFTTLGPDNAWVLWLDSDIIETPPSLIQDLAAHNKPVIVANCYQRYYNDVKAAMDVRPYDFNSWVDSDIAQAMVNKMDYDDVVFEGYAEFPTYRSLLAYMTDPTGNPKAEVELQGVGGSALLVKSDVHRDGAMFPPFAFYNLIETEGFAKMALRLGWKSYGLPNYFVYHLNE